LSAGWLLSTKERAYMTDHDELSDGQLRAIRLNIANGTETRWIVRTLMATIDRRDEALRAALATQPEPDVRDRIIAGLVKVADHGGPSNWRDFLHNAERAYFAAVAGSATPTERDDYCCHDHDCAVHPVVAGSATPTGDDDDPWHANEFEFNVAAAGPATPEEDNDG
jgi:hypothetical protein